MSVTDFPSAGKPVRYRPSAQEESEKNMIHLGDITKIHGNQIEPVHCIIFGSPCQDLSMAGLRLGFGGDRSVLFVDAVRIIGEMRRATNGMYPTFAVWENVPGAFSSNGGEDFRTVLEKLTRVAQPDASIPRPSGGGGSAGNTQEQSSETDGAWLGDSLTLNIGESPSVANESLLSQILEVDVPLKYFLSARACRGILTRASRRGKALPDLLKTALLDMIEWWESEATASAETP
ncbi:MAG: DNA cytosine methyltransferase [Faecalibacterium sp.]